MQNNSCSNVCRFCLETSDTNFETIEDVTFANLDFLWLKLNLSISEEPVMCDECAKTIRNCSDFKTKCLDVENCIVSCVKEKDSIKVDLQEVYVCKMSTENIVNVPEQHIVCRLCLELVENDSAVFLSNHSDIVQNLEQYFPELDLTCAEDPVICASCQVSLQGYFSFINRCLTTEEKIIEYCKVEGTNGMGQINLNSIIRFISKDFLKCKFEVDTVKIEETCNEFSENASNNVEMKREEVLDMELDIKEDSSAQESELTDDNRLQRHPSPSQPDCVPQLTRAIPARYTCGYTQKEDTEVTMYKCDLCDYATKKKSHMKGHMLIHKTHSEITMHKCHLCDYETKWKSGLKDHMLIHKTLSEVTIYKCDLCDYKAKRNSNLKRHMLTHTEIIKCEVCTYKTKHRNHLRQHMLKHKDILKTEMHESEMCLFETKWNGSFHRNTPDVVARGTMYKCDHCDYEAKRKFDLKLHMLIHKTRSEITMYKCYHCDYEGKRKSDLRSHMLIHKTHSEITMYKCEACTYETRHKRCLQQHTLTHMDESEIEMHKCEVCPFKTKWYGSFHEHLRSHRSTAEVVTRGTTYKCDLCQYEAKKKSHLMTHKLIHKTHSEITTFKCNLCDYEAKRKADLTRHTLTHKTHSETTVYKCELCDYEGKQKSSLKRHMLVHKTPSEITMYKCETCAYETKHKDYLHKHRLIHINVSEIKMYKCEVCPFKTKWNRSFRTHQLSHRNTRDVPSNMTDM